jgi:hypothetical protein
MPRAEEVLVWARFDVPANLHTPSDAGMVTRCPTCNQAQTLAEASIASNDETTYTCKNGCQPILIIGRSGGPPWPGRGSSLGDWVIGNPDELRFRMVDQQGNPTGDWIVVPASPAALADESERPPESA